MMSTIFKTTALGDEIERFFSAALKGKVHTDSKGPAPMRIGSQQTPISFGLSEGYSHDDVACFYIARELRNDWKSEIFENLNKDFQSKIEKALSAFREDAGIEVAYVRKQSLDGPL